MKRVPVDSTVILSAGYDPLTRTLEVQLQDGRVSHEPNWEQIAEYNRAWEEALAPLRKLFGGASGGGEWVDGFWRDMCQRQWAGYGGGTWQSGNCY